MNQTYQIYKIGEQIRNQLELLEGFFDPETGELLGSEQDYEFETKRLDNMVENQEIEAADLIPIIKNEKILADQYKSERKRMMVHVKSIEKRSDLYKDILKRFMSKRGVKRLDNGILKASLSSPKKINYDSTQLETDCIFAIENIVELSVDLRSALVPAINDGNELARKLHEMLTVVANNKDFIEVKPSIKKTMLKNHLEKHNPDATVGDEPITGVVAVMPEGSLSIR